jgi:hypothetical protein
VSQPDNQPVILQQTVAQNEAVENVLSRFANNELYIPAYQRDADQWDEVKKSLFIESILNRLTVPAFYLANTEAKPDLSEIVDGQQRLTTLNAFYKNEFALSPHGECPYYGPSPHYATKYYRELDDVWQKAFRRYNLTLVSLPPGMELSLRLEIFRRINEGGTPLSGQDIRLGYYSQSAAVRFIQAAGIFDASRDGAKRILQDVGYAWPWSAFPDEASEWTDWWTDTKGAVGQTPSEMFLWYLISRHREKVYAILSNEMTLASNLKLTFRGNTDEVLDICCAQLRHEEQSPGQPALLPSLFVLNSTDFSTFVRWWYWIRMNCGPSANVAKQRTIALLIPALEKVYGVSEPPRHQWTLIGSFIKSMRTTAQTILKIDVPEPKGKWSSQRKQIEALDAVAKEIAKK